MAKEKPELTDLYGFVTSGSIYKDHLNPLEWFNLIRLSLDACKIVLRRVAENDRDSRTFEALLNYPIKGGAIDEKRITPKEVTDTLPKTLFVNDEWLFMPVKILAASEKKGQFFERQLFVLADYAILVIMDTYFRKEPQSNQRVKHDPPLINENVVGCKVLASAETFGMTKVGFEETIMPYFKDPELKLGEYIMERFFDDAVTELRKAKGEVAEIETAMKPFLDVRTRLGIFNHL